MGGFKQFIAEALRRMPDEKIDNFVDKEWGKGNAYTFEYNAMAAMELAKVFSDVLVTPDNEFILIPSIIDSKQNKELNKVIDKFKLKAVN